MDKTQLTALLQFIKNAPDNDSLTATILRLAADSISLDTLKSLAGSKTAAVFTPQKEPDSDKASGYLHFSKKELSDMPKSFQKSFIYDNRIVKYRYYNGLFQARYRKQGYNIEVASKDFDTMKKKFIDAYNRQSPSEETTDSASFSPKISFGDYGKNWLKIKEQTTKPSTFKEYSRLFHCNLLPAFGKFPLDKITRPMLQDYLFSFVAQKKFRTAEKLKLQLSCIFDMAVEDFRFPSPMKKIVLPYYEAAKGSALSKDEEKKLVRFCLSHPDSKAADAILILLYFGLRQSELPSMTVLDNIWLEVQTSKELLGRNIVKRKIPFTPMVLALLPHIDFAKAAQTNPRTITSALKRVLPNHHPHELRYTYITRCKECVQKGNQKIIIASKQPFSISIT